MAKVLQHRRDTTANLSSVSGAIGEFFMDTTKNTLVVMDGSTNGGHALALESDLYTNSDVDAHLNQSNPTSGYVLSWNGSDYAWVAQASGGDGNTTYTVQADFLVPGADALISLVGSDSSYDSIKLVAGTNITITRNDSSTVTIASTASGGGTSWQTVKTSAFNAAVGEGYFVDTTSAAITATLPASPSLGDEISFIDYAGTFDSNTFTVARNGNNISGSPTDLTVSVERAGFTLVFVDGTQGWLLKDK
jgi:hypothetical protein